MVKRLKKPVYGIRPHVFHIWADEEAEALEMQHGRLLGYAVPTGLDDEALVAALDMVHKRAAIDFDFYFVAMRRLFRIAQSAVREGYGARHLRTAIKTFTAAVPGLVEVRDSNEHADDWLRTGRTRSGGLGLGGGDASFYHGGDQFWLNQTTAAARALYKAIKDTVPSGAPADIVPALRPGEAARAIAEATWHPGDPE